MFQDMAKRVRKPKTEFPKPAKRPVIVKPLTAEEEKEVLMRYSPDRDEKQQST